MCRELARDRVPNTLVGASDESNFVFRHLPEITCKTRAKLAIAGAKLQSEWGQECPSASSLDAVN